MFGSVRTVRDYPYRSTNQTDLMSIVNFFYDKAILPIHEYSLAISNPLSFIDKFIKEVERRIDESEAGGLWCAILSNYYFILKHSDTLSCEQKQMYADKSLNMLNMVYEKNTCKGFLMLTFLYSAESQCEKLSSMFSMVLNDQQLISGLRLGGLGIPQNVQACIFNLLGFSESKEVKHRKAMENLFKAFKLDSTKTFEFLKLFPELNSEIIKILLKENQIQEDRIRKLENKVVELELEPSSKCAGCGAEVGGGPLFREAKDHFKSQV